MLGPRWFPVPWVREIGCSTVRVRKKNHVDCGTDVDPLKSIRSAGLADPW